MAGAFVLIGFPVEPEPHVESPAGKQRLNSLIQVSGLAERLVPIPSRPAYREEILRFHTVRHLDRIEALSAESGGDAGDGSPF